MEDCHTFAKEAFPEFFSVLAAFGKVIAPVRVSDKSFSFRQVGSPDEIAFEALRTILPPKKVFFPQRETLFTWQDGEITDPLAEIPPQVLFGVHPCDLAGLGIMDKIFSALPADSHYMKRREKTIVIGLSCMPDKHCFCHSMGTSNPDNTPGAYDIFFTDIGDAFFVQAHSVAGKNLLQPFAAKLKQSSEDENTRFKQFWVEREQAFTNKFEADNLAAIFDLEKDNQIWEEMANRCLSCGNCTPVCPTCYCFDVIDVPALDGNSGSRDREWDSCQFSGFAKVSGDFNFRPGPVDRLKFWYRHKLHGFDDPHGMKTCVGCGRCTESCPAGIDDIVQVVLHLQGSQEEKKKNEP